MLTDIMDELNIRALNVMVFVTIMTYVSILSEPFFVVVDLFFKRKSLSMLFFFANSNWPVRTRALSCY